MYIVDRQQEDKTYIARQQQFEPAAWSGRRINEVKDLVFLVGLKYKIGGSFYNKKTSFHIIFLCLPAIFIIISIKKGVFKENDNRNM